VKPIAALASDVFAMFFFHRHVITRLM